MRVHAAAALSRPRTIAHRPGAVRVVHGSTPTLQIFSLPKLVLFPSLLLARPIHVACVLPLSALLDLGKSRLSGALTTAARGLRKRAAAVASRQQRIHEHDARHGDLVVLAHAEAFTRDRWVALSAEAASLGALASALEAVRDHVNWLYWADVLKVLETNTAPTSSMLAGTSYS